MKNKFHQNRAEKREKSWNLLSLFHCQELTSVDVVVYRCTIPTLKDISVPATLMMLCRDYGPWIEQTLGLWL